jgi:excisionase family DNA binding protein
VKERYDQVLRASYDDLLDQLQGVVDTRRGLADLRARLPGADIRYLTVAEAATILRVSKMTVYRLVHSGEMEAVRVGRSFRIPEHALHVYLAAEPPCPPQHS